MQSSGSSESGEPAGQFPPWLSRHLPGPIHPSVSDFLRSTCSNFGPGDPGCSDFELRCLVSLAKASFPAPPPPPPARQELKRGFVEFALQSMAIAGYIKGRHILLACPTAILEQSKRFANGALEHYNKRKKIKFELVDVMPFIMMPESGRYYTHVNFIARSIKEGSPEKLFFAELYNCSKRQAPNGYLVTCCEPLGSDSTVGHKGFQLDGTSMVRKNVDFTCCFAYSPRMHHPKDHKYVAGHCNIPYIYDNTC